ncbi:MAG: 23S rRNA (adenine(2503)-C(2))-methyltransferase RlmN, partial [Planctomycetes bacterium]|nr:23S rRNA (adenine(2503)-C(2))-methyltransferase RlmN [Planctomycetota bacterium]
GCTFCATGRLGFVRNLTAGEIVEQAYIIDARLRERGEKGLSHIVYMGMGEPLLNLDAVLASAAILHNPNGLGLSGRHLTISTVGIPAGLRRLAESGMIHRLAVSLHAPNQKIREQILPAATRWPLSELLPALESYAESAARDITFEYALIDKVNSSPRDAKELAALLAPFRGLVNLIPLNPVPGVPLKPPPAAAIRRFQEVLENAGQPATVRMEKGAEIGAACGQLRAEATGEDR